MKRIDALIPFGDEFSANLIVSNLDGTNTITRPMHSFTSIGSTPDTFSSSGSTLQTKGLVYMILE